jgi:ferrous-iron efflux pump FieF
MNGHLMRRAAFASISVAVFLVLLKFFAFLATDSISLLASLADSALDVIASGINLLAIHSALTPADREHRFGHGKAEPLAGLAQFAFIGGSAIFLVIEASQRFVTPWPVEHGAVGIAVMLVSIALTSALVAYQRYVTRRTNSLAVHADSAHYAGDLLTNLGVIVGIVLAAFFDMPLADPVIGLAVAAVLAWSAWGVFRGSYDQLMDRELPDDTRDRIKAIVRSHPEIVSLHDLRTRMAGAHIFMQLHIELDPRMSLTRAHEVSDEVEKQLCDAFPGAQVIIHQDPAGAENAIPALSQS